MEYIDVDELRWDCFAQQPDYDNDIVEALFSTSKEIEAFSYFKPFEARMVVDFLKENPCGVFDFGAGYSVYEDERLFNDVKSVFSQYEYVILLRYSDNADESLEALHKRHADISDELYYALNETFIKSPCNELLATHIVDTKDKTIDEVVHLVLKIVRQ